MRSIWTSRGARRGRSGRAAADVGVYGARHTTKFDAVERVMNASDVFLSARDVRARLLIAGESVSLSTVYRVLRALVDADSLDVIRDRHGQTLFRACGPRHHHHLVCRACGQVRDVEGEELDALVTQIADESGFVDVVASSLLSGTCAACRGKRRYCGPE